MMLGKRRQEQKNNREEQREMKEDGLTHVDLLSGAEEPYWPLPLAFQFVIFVAFPHIYFFVFFDRAVSTPPLA
jgi:hypothetical protein